MDEKWVIIYDQLTLNFYRSWTGRGIFKIQFLEKENELIVDQAFVEETFSKQRGIDYCALILNWVIEVVMFGRDVELPKTRSK